MGHKACKLECSIAHVEAEKARKLKRERQEGLQRLKRRADYIADAQKAFNAFVRERDKNQPCICCGKETTKVEGLRSHGWDCGHYRSTGSAPHLRFNEDNAHRQKVLCNRYGGGRAVDYRLGLITRIGLARVEALECNDTPRKWSIDELKAIKAHYVAELKKLKGSS